MVIMESPVEIVHVAKMRIFTALIFLTTCACKIPKLMILVLTMENSVTTGKTHVADLQIQLIHSHVYQFHLQVMAWDIVL